MMMLMGGEGRTSAAGQTVKQQQPFWANTILL
jgi:hypothetical protein